MSFLNLVTWWCNGVGLHSNSHRCDSVLSLSSNKSRQVVYTHVPLPPSRLICYWPNRRSGIAPVMLSVLSTYRHSGLEKEVSITDAVPSLRRGISPFPSPVVTELHEHFVAKKHDFKCRHGCSQTKWVRSVFEFDHSYFPPTNKYGHYGHCCFV